MLGQSSASITSSTHLLKALEAEAQLARSLRGISGNGSRWLLNLSLVSAVQCSADRQVTCCLQESERPVKRPCPCCWLCTAAQRLLATM